MSETATEQPTAEGPTAPRKRGRPRKYPLPATQSTTTDQLTQALSARIRELETRLAEATTTTGPRAARPGELKQVGIDAKGAPILAKERWKKPDIERSYPSVTFVPERTMVVAPHGVQYSLVQGQNVVVPSIVKAVHDETMRTERNLQRAFQPWSSAELDTLSQRAMMEPGQRHPSRVARLGVGLYVGEQRPAQ